MRVLVDTSVWVDHFRNRNNGLTALLENNDVLCHPFVIGELACGILQRRAEILESLSALPSAPSVQHGEALHFMDSHKLVGKGIGFIDVNLLASAYLGKVKLWTRDKRLRELASRLGVESEQL
jgi:predicted nucleic acid-binding protein